MGYFDDLDPETLPGGSLHGAPKPVVPRLAVRTGYFDDLDPDTLPDVAEAEAPEKPGVFEEYVKPVLHKAGAVLSTPYRLVGEAVAPVTGLVKTGDPLSEFKLTPEARDRGTLGDIAAEFGLADPTHVEAGPYEGAIKPAVQRATRALAGYDEATSTVPLDPGSEATLQARNKGLFTAEKVGDIGAELLLQMGVPGTKIPGLDPLLTALGSSGKAAKIGELADVILETRSVPSMAVQLLKDAGIDASAGALKADLVPVLAELSQKGKQAALAGRAIGASFLPGMGLGAAEKLGSAPEAVRQHGLISPQAAEAIVGGAVDLGFTAFGAKHAAFPGEHLSAPEQALFDKQVDELAAKQKEESKPQAPPLPPGVMSPELQQAFADLGGPQGQPEGPIKPPGIETLPPAYGMPWEQARAQAPELPWEADRLAPTDEARAAEEARQAALNTPPPAVPPGMMDVWPGRARPIEAPVGVDERSAMLQAAADRDLLDRVEADRAAKQQAADEALLQRVQAEKAARDAAQARVNEIRGQNALAALEAERAGQPAPPPDLAALLPEDQSQAQATPPEPPRPRLVEAKPPEQPAIPPQEEAARAEQAAAVQQDISELAPDVDPAHIERVLQAAADALSRPLTKGERRDLLQRSFAKELPSASKKHLFGLGGLKEEPAKIAKAIKEDADNPLYLKAKRAVALDLQFAAEEAQDLGYTGTGDPVAELPRGPVRFPYNPDIERPQAPPQLRLLTPGKPREEPRFPYNPNASRETLPETPQRLLPAEVQRREGKAEQPKPHIPTLPEGFGAMGAEPGRPKAPTPRVPPGFGVMGAEGRFPERVPERERAPEKPPATTIEKTAAGEQRTLVGALDTTQPQRPAEGFHDSPLFNQEAEAERARVEKSQSSLFEEKPQEKPEPAKTPEPAASGEPTAEDRADFAEAQRLLKAGSKEDLNAAKPYEERLRKRGVWDTLFEESRSEAKKKRDEDAQPFAEEQRKKLLDERGLEVGDRVALEDPGNGLGGGRTVNGQVKQSNGGNVYVHIDDGRNVDVFAHNWQKAQPAEAPRPEYPDTIHVRFQRKPSAEVRDSLKQHGFRWDKDAAQWTKRRPTALDVNVAQKSGGTLIQMKDGKRIGPEPLPVVGGARGPKTEAERFAGDALVQLAGMDPDHARERNNAGFSQFDGQTGHELARRYQATGELTDAQWAKAKSLATKYRRQVGEMPAEEVQNAAPAGRTADEPAVEPEGGNAPALGAVPPEAHGAPEGSGEVRPDAERGGAEHAGRLQPDGGEGRDTTGRLGGSPGGVVPAPARAEGAEGKGKPAEQPRTEEDSSVVPEPVEKEVHATKAKEKAPDTRQEDYRITPEDRIGDTSVRQKAADNVAALEILKDIEATGRLPTEEERQKLVRFSGWGALAQQMLDRPWKYEAHWGEKARHTEFAALRERLGKLMSEDERDAAEKSALNAHYTDPKVVAPIWDAIRRLGIRAGARFLEPAVGVGHFYGTMPADLIRDSVRTGIDLDPITAKIAKLLYPRADIRDPIGFEEAPLPKEFYDVSLSNVPFGDYGVSDKAFKNTPFLTKAIHDYYFAKALEHVRPGGLVAFITSRYTMDKTSSQVRRYLASKADLLGAVRLPAGTFSRNAGTEVTTDVLFLRKRAPGEAPSGESWVESSAIKVPHEDRANYPNEADVPVNEYFQRHPELMLGDLKVGRGMHNDHEPKLVGEFDADRFKEALAKALPEGAIKPRIVKSTTPGEAARPLLLEDPTEVKNFGYIEKGGKIHQRIGGELVPTKYEGKQAERIKGMLGVRDALSDALRTQLDGSSEGDIDQARARLNKAYDKFVKEHGPLSARVNAGIFRQDPDAPRLLALEHYDHKSGSATKAAIFSKRTLELGAKATSADSTHDALAISMAEEGGINWERIAQLTGKSILEAQRDLEGTSVFRNPESASWEPADQYLSGNVRAKLKAAEAAAKADPAFKVNAEALRRVLPEEIPADQIGIRKPPEAPRIMGATWIEPKDYAQFVDFITRDHGAKVAFDETTGTWFVDSPSPGRIQGKKIADLVEDALNQKTAPRVTTEVDGKRVVDPVATTALADEFEKIKDAFARWLWSDSERAARVKETYQERFASHVNRTFDGSRLEFPGMSRAELRDGKLGGHQSNGVMRIVHGGNTLLAHEVGLGKTYTMIASAMELRRLGLAKRPMFTVPPHLLGQWGKAFMTLYPGAKVLVAAPKDLEAANRKLFMSHIATGDWDAVIVSREGFGKIPVSKETEAKYIKSQLKEIDEALASFGVDTDRLSSLGQKSASLVTKITKSGETKQVEDAEERAQIRKEEEALVDEALEARDEAPSSGYGRRRRAKKDSAEERTVKQIAKAKAALQAKLKTLLETQRDDTITFEELGIDHLFVDEAHEYKGLPFYSKMNRVAGLQQRRSQRATDMHMKSQLVTALHGGERGLVFATGTPIANTMAEMYTMQKYLAEKSLREAGVRSFDSWAAQFGTTVTSTEQGVDLQWRQKSRFKEFINVPELSRMFRQFADVRFADDPDIQLPRPALHGGKPIVESVPEPAFMGVFVKSLIQRLEDARSGEVKPTEDNPLKIATDARKAALDYRLIEPSYPDDPSSKLNQAVKNVFNIWEETKDKKSTQAIFADLGTPSDERREVESEKGEAEAAEALGASEDLKAEKKAAGEEEAPDVAEEKLRFDVYSDIKNKLVKKGIPPSEIAFVHDYDKPEAKLQLYADVNAGRVRVILGSTGKMSTGANIQQRLLALHHLDAPWRPADVEQREGRAIRQGNSNESVKIYRYVTEGSFDAFMWGILKSKGTFIRQIMKGDQTQRFAEDVGDITISAAEAEAVASGNPGVIRKLDLEAEIAKLFRLKTAYERRKNEDTQRVSGFLPQKLAGLDREIEAIENAKEVLGKTSGTDFSMKVGGQTYADRKEAGPALAQAAQAAKDGDVIGSYRGIDLVAKDKPVEEKGRVVLTEKEANKAAADALADALKDNPGLSNEEKRRIFDSAHDTAVAGGAPKTERVLISAFPGEPHEIGGTRAIMGSTAPTAEGAISSIDAHVRQIDSRHKDAIRRREETARDIEESEARLKQPWDREEALAKAQAELASINKSLQEASARKIGQQAEEPDLMARKAQSKEAEREQRLKFWRSVVDDPTFPAHLREHIRQSLAEEEARPSESTPASKLKRDDLLDRAVEEAEATATAADDVTSVADLTTGERAVRAAAAQKIVDRAGEADTEDARAIEALGLADRKEARLLSKTMDRLRIDSPVYDQVSRRLQDLVSKGAVRLDRAQAIVDSIQERAGRAADRASSFLDRVDEAQQEGASPELRDQVAEEARRFLEEKKARQEKGYAFKATEGARTADVKRRVKVAEARPDKVELGDKVNIASPDEAHDAIAESLGSALGYEPAKAIRRAADSLANLVGRTIGKKAPAFLGLTVDGGAHGYSLPEGVRVNVLAEWERAQGRASLKKTEAGQSVEREAARGIVNVLIHEIAHATVKGHGKAHDAEMLRIMRAVSGEPLLKLRAAIEQALKGKDVGSVLEQAKGVWGETGKRGGRDRGADRGIPAETGDRPGAGPERPASGEGGRAGLAETVPPGSRGEAGELGTRTDRGAGESGAGRGVAPELMERRAPGVPEPAPGIPQPKEPEKQEAKPAPGQPGFERRPIRPIPPEATPAKPETAGMLPKGLDTGVMIQYIPKGGGPAREGVVIHAPKGGTVDVKLDGRPGIVKLPEADLKAIGHLKDSLMRPRFKGMTAEQSRAALGRAWADKEPGDITGKPSEGTAPFNLNHMALSPDNREKMARIWKASKDAYEKAAGRRTLEDVRLEGEELLREVGGRGTVEEAVKAGVPLGDGKFVHAARLVLAEQARELNEAGAKMREAARTGVGKAEAEKELLLRALEHANYSLAFRGAQAQAARALAAFRIAAETTGTVSDLLRRSLNWSC